MVYKRKPKIYQRNKGRRPACLMGIINKEAGKSAQVPVPQEPTGSPGDAPGTKRGRGVKIQDPVRIKKALVEMIGGKNTTIVSACETVGIVTGTFYEWIQKDLAFLADIRKAQESRVLAVEDSLYTQAIKGEASCIFFFLANRTPERWKSINRPHVEVNNNLKLEDGEKYGRMSDRELRREFDRRRLLLQKRANKESAK